MKKPGHFIVTLVQPVARLFQRISARKDRYLRGARLKARHHTAIFSIKMLALNLLISLLYAAMLPVILTLASDFGTIIPVLLTIFCICAYALYFYTTGRAQGEHDAIISYNLHDDASFSLADKEIAELNARQRARNRWRWFAFFSVIMILVATAIIPVLLPMINQYGAAIPLTGTALFIIFFMLFLLLAVQAQGKHDVIGNLKLYDQAVYTIPAETIQEKKARAYRASRGWIAGAIGGSVGILLALAAILFWNAAAAEEGITLQYVLDVANNFYQSMFAFIHMHAFINEKIPSIYPFFFLLGSFVFPFSVALGYMTGPFRAQKVDIAIQKHTRRAKKQHSYPYERTEKNSRIQ